MCGRFVNRHDRSAFRHWVDADWDDDEVQLPLSFNVAPTQPIQIIHADDENLRRLYIARWGLIPSWSKDRKIASRMINARAETVATTNAFRVPFQRRRCIVPMSGYYEWTGEVGDKQPYFIHVEGGGPLAAAGVYERWQDPATGEVVDTATIITTAAAPDVRALHERMPVFIAPDRQRPWLDRDAPLEVAQQLLLPTAGLVFGRVGRAVNNVRNNRPDLLDPVSG